MEQKTSTLSERRSSEKSPILCQGKGVLLANLSSESAEVQVRKGARCHTGRSAALSGVPLHATLITPEEFDRALAIAFAHSDGSAASMWAM